MALLGPLSCRWQASERLEQHSRSGGLLSNAKKCCGMICTNEASGYLFADAHFWLQVLDLHLGNNVPTISNLRAMPSPTTTIWPQALFHLDWQGMALRGGQWIGPSPSRHSGNSRSMLEPGCALLPFIGQGVCYCSSEHSAHLRHHASYLAMPLHLRHLLMPYKPAPHAP